MWPFGRRDSVESLQKDILSIVDKKVHNIMKKPITTEPSSVILEAAAIMTKHNFGALPVMNGDELVGILSERDFVYKSPKLMKEKELYSTTVSKIMSKGVISVRPDATLREANKILVENKIRKLPVVSDGKLVGILTQSDLVRVFALGDSLLLDMDNTPKTEDIQSSPVYTVTQETKVKDAVKVMTRKKFGSLPVVHGKKPIGMFTERDFVRALVRAPGNMDGVKIKDVCAQNIVTVPGLFSIFEANQIMIRNGFRRLPVMNLSGKMTGIITQSDLNRELYQFVNTLVRDIEQGRIKNVSRTKLSTNQKKTLVHLNVENAKSGN